METVEDEIQSIMMAMRSEGKFLNLLPNGCFVEQLTCLIQILLLIFALRHSRAYELCSDCSHHSIFMGAGGIIWHFYAVL